MINKGRKGKREAECKRNKRKATGVEYENIIVGRDRKLTEE